MFARLGTEKHTKYRSRDFPLPVREPIFKPEYHFTDSDKYETKIGTAETIESNDYRGKSFS